MVDLAVLELNLKLIICHEAISLIFCGWNCCDFYHTSTEAFTETNICANWLQRKTSQAKEHH